MNWLRENQEALVSLLVIALAIWGTYIVLHGLFSLLSLALGG